MTEVENLGLKSQATSPLDWIYDVSNVHELIVNFLLLLPNSSLVIMILINIRKIRLWSKAEEVKEGKLLCINFNNLIVCIGIIKREDKNFF